MVRKRSLENSQPPEEQRKPANKARVRFIFEPDRTSPNGITFSWLIHNAYNGKEKGATAVRAFWLPFAYQDQGSSSPSELRELAQQSVWRLEEQIQHLREAFGLETALRQGSIDVNSSADRLDNTISTLSEAADAPASFLASTKTSIDAALLDEFSEVI